MSLPSLYTSGDDEEELFRLTDPDDHPNAADESAARKEEESLAGSSYDDAQEEFDEMGEPSSLAITGNSLQELTNDELAEVIELIEAIRNRRWQRDETRAVTGQ